MKVMLFIGQDRTMVSRYMRVATKYDIYLETINVKDGETELLREYDIKTTPTLVCVTWRGKRYKYEKVLSESQLNRIFTQLS